MGEVRLRGSLGISLVVHGLLLAGMMLVATGRADRAHAPRPIWVQIDPVPESLLKQHKSASDASKRIVQTAPGKQVKEAPQDAFLGERNQVVDRQTVSKSRRTSIGESAAAPAAKQTAPRAMAQTEQGPKSKAATPALSQLGLPILPSQQKRLTPQEELQQERTPTFGTGLTQDYVKGLKESETTALNTREYVFFGYFQRIRQRLDRAWNGTLRDQLDRYYRAGRQLASEMDHTTRVLVTLNSAGEVVRVQILEESGTRDLDDAAVNAFNKAGPFPNPPKGILDPKGYVQIRWDFILRT